MKTSQTMKQAIENAKKEERKKLICSTCGFPKEIVREPVILDNNVLSLISHIDGKNRCPECNHMEDGSTIPIVAKKIREIATKVKENTRLETAREIFEDIRKFLESNKQFEGTGWTIENTIDRLLFSIERKWLGE